jgi:hypothetical protein
MSYEPTRYDGNGYSTWNEKIRKSKSELDALQHGSDGNFFPPEEIRGIIATLREASAKLAEEATLEELSLIRDLRKKLDELTEAVISKSAWDWRFRNTD